MMYRLTIILLSFAFFTFSCSNDNDTSIIDSSSQQLLISEKPNFTAPLSSIMKVEKILCLKTNGREYISRIDNTQVHQDRVYVLDRFSSTQGLYVFDNEGNFLFNVGQPGDMPGGFNIPYDFIVNSADNQIELLTNGKINVYTIDTGEFIESRHMNYLANRFVKYQNRYVFMVGGNLHDEKVVITDSNFKKITGSIVSETIYSMQPTSTFITLEGKILFQQYFDNTIYEIKDDDSIEPYLTIAFEGFAPLSDADKKMIHSPEQTYRILADKKLVTASFLFTENKIIFPYHYNGDFFTVIHDKISGTSKILSVVNGVDNDILPDDKFPYFYGYTDNGNFLASLNLEQYGTSILNTLGCTEEADHAIAFIRFLDE